MSVFTAVDTPALERFLAGYAVGRRVAHEGIAAGVQNSNFFVDTALGRYVLTLFERVDRSELPFYLHLMAHLARHGLPVPAPIANRDNEYLGQLCGRPAVLVARLAGASQMRPGPAHWGRIGAMLAGLHLAGLSYGRRLANPRGPGWREAMAVRLLPLLGERDRAVLEAERAFQRTADFSRLPQGVIHADLFRDNVLWTGDGYVGGVIDFYFAGHDALLFDVAVTVNDWCAQDDGELDPGGVRCLLTAYHEVRPFSAAEADAWPAMLRAAALRFWLSRLADALLPRAGEMVLVKDPDEYRNILLRRSAGTRLPWLR